MAVADPSRAGCVHRCVPVIENSPLTHTLVIGWYALLFALEVSGYPLIRSSLSEQ